MVKSKSKQGAKSKSNKVQSINAKKPMSAYFLFQREKSDELKSKNPNLKFTEVSKLCNKA